MHQYLHVRSSTSSLCWANERTWLGREAKNWLQWRCNLARLKKGRSTCSIHYVNRSTQSALTELCEMNAYTDVKNARKRWRKNGALQTRHLVSPPLNLPGDLSSLSKLACFVMYDILAVLVRALIITSVWFRLFFFFFFTYCYFHFPHLLHFWPLDVSLSPPSPTCETRCEGRVYFLLSSLCVLVHINIRTLYVFHALSTRGWTKCCLRPGRLWRSLVLCACYIAHVVMLPRISLTPSFLVEILCTLERFFAGSLTILFVNTQALLMTHLFLCFVLFSIAPGVVTHLLCVVQQPTPSPFESWCVTCYGAI